MCAGRLGEDRRRRPRTWRGRGQLDERHHLVAPARARPADHHDVVHRGMVAERALDLLGEDLLAAGVDGHRVAAVQLDDHPSAAHARGRRAPRSARRSRSGRCARSCPHRRGSRAASRPDFASQPISSSSSPSSRVEVGATSTWLPGDSMNVPVDAAPPGGHVLHLPARFGRAEAVDDDQRRQMGEELLLQRRRRAARRPRAAR